MNKSSGPVSLYDERLQEILDYGGLTLKQELEQLKLLEESVVDKDNVEQDIFNNFDTNDLYDQFFTQKKKKYESISYSIENWAKVNPFNKRLLADWIFEIRTRRIRPTTIEQYYGDAKLVVLYILLYLNNIKLTEVTKKQWKSYILFLINTDLSNARINRILSVIRNITSFLEESDDYPDYTVSTASRIQGISREPRRQIVFINNHDFMLLYNHLMKIKAYKEATLIALAYESAGRKNELAQVRADTIQDNSNTTNLVIGKRGKRFQLIYFDLTKKAKKAYMKTRKDDNPMLFVNKNGETMNGNMLYLMMVGLRQVFTDLTGKDLKFNVHSFRHSSLENYNNGTHEVCKKKKIGNIAIDKLKHISHHSSIEVCNSYLRDKSQTELEDLFGITINGH